MTRSCFAFARALASARAGAFASAPVVIATLLAGCASAPTTPPARPEVPAALRPAAGETLFLEALATGVQIYECTTKPDEAATYVWIFRSPEASLADAAGKRLGKHYAGPTWESLHGSTVVGEVKARDPGPDKQAIPWLLLTAKSTTGSGEFAQTKSIQRVQTVGGAAPSQPCSVANATQLARVPYKATYYFYR
jgi:hypothetical protein